VRGKSPPESYFRCIQADFAEHNNVIAISAETAASLDVVEGDELFALALARHTRL
jgi:hypothetical protein